jgi:UMF1 family MFS transporter
MREGTRATGPFAALWFAIFMIPYFLWVREVRTTRKRASIPQALSTVIDTIKRLKSRPSLGVYLVSSMLYRDGLNGLYTFGGVYAALVLNWEVSQIGMFGVIAAIGAMVFSYFGGFMDRKFGPKPVVVCAIVMLMIVSFVIINLSPTTFFGVALAAGTGLPDMVFLVCGVFIGGMGGIVQSASRSLMVRHCDPETSTEYFGLYGMSGRATAFLAPLLIGITTHVTGSARLGISPVLFLFAIGLFLLIWVNAQGEDTAAA